MGFGRKSAPTHGREIVSNCSLTPYLFLDLLSLLSVSISSVTLEVTLGSSDRVTSDLLRLFTPALDFVLVSPDVPLDIESSFAETSEFDDGWVSFSEVNCAILGVDGVAVAGALVFSDDLLLLVFSFDFTCCSNFLTASSSWSSFSFHANNSSASFLLFLRLNALLERDLKPWERIGRYHEINQPFCRLFYALEF